MSIKGSVPTVVLLFAIINCAIGRLKAGSERAQGALLSHTVRAIVRFAIGESFIVTSAKPSVQFALVS